MDDKSQKHAKKMAELKKHFKALKMRAIIIWAIINILVITLSVLLLSVEITIFAIIICIIISTMIMINYLNRLDKIRIARETQLMEDTPLSRLKF